jgi:hypothetical protein
MVWSALAIADLILVGKDVYIHLSESICRKLDLGKPIDQDVDMLYLLCNIVFALENDSTNWEDEDYDLMAEDINRIEVQRNRTRGL